MKLTLGIIVVIGAWLDSSKEKRNNKNILKGLRRSFLLKNYLTNILKMEIIPYWKFIIKWGHIPFS